MRFESIHKVQQNATTGPMGELTAPPPDRKLVLWGDGKAAWAGKGKRGQARR